MMLSQNIKTLSLAIFSMVAHSAALFASTTFLSSSGTQISEFNTVTGQSTFLASTGLDRGYQGYFDVDSMNSIAYRYGVLDEVGTLSAVNLITGVVQTIPYDGASFSIYQIPEPRVPMILGLATSLALLRRRPATLDRGTNQ